MVAKRRCLDHFPTSRHSPMAKCGNGRKDPQPSVVSVATGRRLEHSSGFAKDLQSFAKKKDPGLPKWIHQALTSRLKQGPGNDWCLRGFQSLPLFKMRIRTQGRGKRGGACVVYYCDQEILLPLLIYVKSQKAHMTSADCKSIRISSRLLASGQSEGPWMAPRSSSR